MKSILAVTLSATFFTWPALLNGYPLLFSDTGGFLEQALMPDVGWDKPWIYGPFLTPFHARLTLWPVPLAQALILSALIWVTQATLTAPSPARHIALSAILAAGTAAPWFTSLIMPDILAPACVLGLFILANPGRHGRTTLLWVGLVTTIAIAAHLAHLVLAAACIATLGLLRPYVSWRLPWRPLAPLAAALALIVVTNAAGHGRFAVSPYGAVFALARLVADGPGRVYLNSVCPGAGYRLCAWRDRLPTDSDKFLWDPYGPVWAESYGPLRIALEAAALVPRIIAAEPTAVLAAAARNTATQLTMAEIGDVLVPDHLKVAVLERVQAYFPPGEAGRLTQSLQFNGRLQPFAVRLNPLYAALLTVGATATLGIALLGWRRDRPIATFAALILVALVANAFSTGALSGPHDRYQARIAWLVLLPPLIAGLNLAPGLRRRP